MSAGQRQRGQSLVELALVAPVLIILAMAVWDGGSALREQVVLQQAARDGARVAATGYGPSVSTTVVSDAVVASARDLPGLSATPGYLAVNYPDAQSVQVRLTYNHALITPVLRQIWGGGSGTLRLQASATFYLPQLTPTPTAAQVNLCTLGPAAQSVPSLAANTGYWCRLRITTASIIAAGWQVDNGTNQLLIYATSPDPFSGQPDPTGLTPPAGSVSVADRGNGSIIAGTPGCVGAGTYTVYFFAGGASFPATSGLVTAFACQ